MGAAAGVAAGVKAGVVTPSVRSAVDLRNGVQEMPSKFVGINIG